MYKLKVIFLFLFIFSTSAKSLVLNGSEQFKYNIREYLTYTVTAENLNIDSLKSTELNHKFKHKPLINYTKKNIYLKATIHNNNYKEIKINLYYEFANLGVLKGRVFSDKRNSFDLPIIGSDTITDNNNIIYPHHNLTIQPQETIEIVLHRKGRMRFDGNIFIMDDTTLSKTNDLHENILFFFIGGVLFLLIYNSFFFTVVRKKYQLYYILLTLFYTPTILLLGNFFNGFDITIFNFNIAKNAFLFSASSIIFQMKFLKYFLDFKKSKHIDKLKFLNYFTIILVTLTPVEMFLNDYIPFYLGELLDLIILLAVSFTFYLAFLRMKEGNVMAKFFTISYSANFFAISLWFSHYFRIIEESFFTKYSLLIGCSLELIIFSIGMAYRFKILETEKSQAILEAREKQKYQNNLRILAHDLSNPITAATMSLQMVDIIPDANEKALKAIKQMEETIKMMREREKQDSTEEKLVNVYRSFRQTEETFEHKLKEKNLSLKFKGNKKTYIPFGSHSFQFNVLNNLISNAIKFSTKGGEIHVALSEDSEYHILEVTDQGSGMDEDTLEKLRNKEITTSLGTDGESGTGFGTQIMSQILEEMSCHLDIDSSLGEGTKFTIKFPKA